MLITILIFANNQLINEYLVRLEIFCFFLKNGIDPHHDFPFPARSLTV